MGRQKNLEAFALQPQPVSGWAQAAKDT